MPEIGRLFCDGDDVRITDGDDEYIKIPGDTVEAEAPNAPTGFKYDRATGALAWNDQVDAAEYRVKANEVDGGPSAARDRAVATVAAPTLTTNDGALQDGESRAFEIRAYCDYSEIEGPGTVIFASASNKKL